MGEIVEEDNRTWQEILADIGSKHPNRIDEIESRLDRIEAKKDTKEFQCLAYNIAVCISYLFDKGGLPSFEEIFPSEEA